MTFSESVTIVHFANTTALLVRGSRDLLIFLCCIILWGIEWQREPSDGISSTRNTNLSRIDSKTIQHAYLSIQITPYQDALKVLKSGQWSMLDVVERLFSAEKSVFLNLVGLHHCLQLPETSVRPHDLLLSRSSVVIVIRDIGKKVVIQNLAL